MLSSDFQPLELWNNKFPLFKLSSLQWCAAAALTGQHKHEPKKTRFWWPRFWTICDVEARLQLHFYSVSNMSGELRWHLAEKLGWLKPGSKVLKFYPYNPRCVEHWVTFMVQPGETTSPEENTRSSAVLITTRAQSHLANQMITQLCSLSSPLGACSFCCLLHIQMSAPEEKHKDYTCLFDVRHSGCCSWPQWNEICI